MPAVRIDALCVCDGCEKRFGVELDLAADLKDGPCADFEELVHETVRSGNHTSYTWGVRGKATVDRLSLSGETTVQAGLLLCDECTKKCDAVPVERNLTRAEVNEALGIPQADA